MEINLKIIEDDEELQKSRNLRYKVFVLEQGVDENFERDENDNNSIHILAFAEGQILGTGRLTFYEKRAKISRVAVEKKFRGKGIGKKLMMELEKIAAENGVKNIFLSSNFQSIEFYEKMRYEKIGETFIECGVECQRMVKKVFA